MLTKEERKQLQITACKVRMGVIDAVYSANSGHPGGSLSASDVFTWLYFKEMNVDPANPKWEDRDRFVLSKGHCAPGLYSTLANRGFFPVEDLKTLRKIGSYLQGHPNMNLTPGVDMSTGSLGQGISTAVGMAMGAKRQGKEVRVYVDPNNMYKYYVDYPAALQNNKIKYDNTGFTFDDNGVWYEK